jgi:hypothetical protein
MGREILIARGLAEWFLSFSRKPSLDAASRNFSSQRNGTQEITEDMVILFANMVQGGAI